MHYTVFYKLFPFNIFSLFCTRLYPVVDEGFLGLSHRVFILSDGTRFELPLSSMFLFAPDHFYFIHSHIEADSGKSIPLIADSVQYTVRFKLWTGIRFSFFWHTIPNVIGDLIVPSGSHRALYLADRSHIEVPISSLFSFSPERPVSDTPPTPL